MPHAIYARVVETAGKLLLAAALVLAALGVGALVLSRLGVDRLPGTIRWKPSDDVSVVVPVGLMIVVSIVATIVLNLIFRR
jgi:membrane protease YdiL (CAAX protease family)